MSTEKSGLEEIMMQEVTWTTEHPLQTNSETMNDYINNLNTLDIITIDGTYAEGRNSEGQIFAIHASGDGDCFNHRVTFELINQEK